jgi:predicted DNA-binding transcriptional regulator AlpA
MLRSTAGINISANRGGHWSTGRSSIQAAACHQGERARAVTGRKHGVERGFPPDYVSAETLAYRLDCARSTVDDYVRRGLLPKRRIIGNLQRWRWSEIEAWIVNLDAMRPQLGSRDTDDEDDPYSLGVKRVTTSYT